DGLDLFQLILLRDSSLRCGIYQLVRIYYDSFPCVNCFQPYFYSTNIDLESNPSSGTLVKCFWETRRNLAFLVEIYHEVIIVYSTKWILSAVLLSTLIIPACSS